MINQVQNNDQQTTFFIKQLSHSQQSTSNVKVPINIQ